MKKTKAAFVDGICNGHGVYAAMFTGYENPETALTPELEAARTAARKQYISVIRQFTRQRTNNKVSTIKAIFKAQWADAGVSANDDFGQGMRHMYLCVLGQALHCLPHNMRASRQPHHARTPQHSVPCWLSCANYLRKCDVCNESYGNNYVPVPIRGAKCYAVKTNGTCSMCKCASGYAGVMYCYECPLADCAHCPEPCSKNCYIHAQHYSYSKTMLACANDRRNQQIAGCDKCNVSTQTCVTCATKRQQADAVQQAKIAQQNINADAQTKWQKTFDKK